MAGGPTQEGVGERLLDPKAAGPFGNQKSLGDRWKVFLVIAVLFVIGTIALQRYRGEPTQEPIGLGGKPASKPATLSVKSDKEAWMGQAQAEIKGLQDQTHALESALRQIREQSQSRVQQGLPAAVTPKSDGGLRQQVRDAILPPSSGLPPLLGEASPAVPPMGAPPSRSQATPTSLPGLPRPSNVFGASSASGATAGAAQFDRIRVFVADPLPPQSEANPSKYWIPTGTIVPVKLLSGVDAPAKDQQLGGSPYPVLMVVSNLSMLPNDVKMDMKECFVLGEAIGDLSEERAQIRALSLSCVRKSDKVAVDLPVKGVVTGEDGKVGMRGPVVQREGAILAKALLAGFVSGVSRAFQPYQQGFFIAPSAQQAVQFPEPGNVGLAGAAGGMGRAAEVLARHYTKLANSIYPVIEIDAGRTGNLIITEGRELKEQPK